MYLYNTYLYPYLCSDKVLMSHSLSSFLDENGDIWSVLFSRMQHICKISWLCVEEPWNIFFLPIRHVSLLQSGLVQVRERRVTPAQRPVNQGHSRLILTWSYSEKKKYSWFPRKCHRDGLRAMVMVVMRLGLDTPQPLLPASELHFFPQSRLWC